MTHAGPQAGRSDPWGSLEPYVQIIRSLMPRASSVALFDVEGTMRWSNEAARVRISPMSSLAYLRQLPVSLLKMDGSFVRDILTDARSESMVNAIALLARSMSIGTVAEYVETEEIRTRVAALGVDDGQGFAIGRPEPFEEVLTQLSVLAAASPAFLAGEDSMPKRHAINLH